MSIIESIVKKQTEEHIQQVQSLLQKAIVELRKRLVWHDHSKLEPPEVEIFEEYTHLLRGLTYGSQEYFDTVAKMKPALDHHYAENRHHPEHFVNGIQGMTLIDLLEMICDWKAATLRHADGDIQNSLEVNQKRFHYSDELKQILRNTVVFLEGQSLDNA